MNRKLKVLASLAIPILMTGLTVGVGTAMAEPGLIVREYGDISLTGGGTGGNLQAYHFPEVWDLTACDMTITAEYDAYGLVDDYGGDAHAWAELGVRQSGGGDFNPNNKGVWLATDYDWTANTFDPDPAGAPTQDLDDKLILQKVGGYAEGLYDLPSAPPNPWANYAFWFDRDGVDQWQAQSWGAIDGVTYNTGGVYAIEITLHATGASAGEAYLTVNGEAQGFYVPNWHAGAPDLWPAGMTFSGNMAQMQVFYGIYGYGATHSVEFRGIKVDGCLADQQGPVTSNVMAAPDLVSVNVPVTITATVDDTTTGGSNIVSAEYSLDGVLGQDLNTQDEAFDEVSEDVTGSFSISEPGVYNICVRGTDVVGNTGDEACAMLVVYDPSGGFVTGGGWIDSLAGAYVPDPTLAGRANFGFVSRYKKGASTPDGNTEFVFRAAGLNFHSSSYDWLVVNQGGTNAQFKGTGTINGSGNYRFMLWAGDGDPDTFRIKIWEDINGTENVIYDNGMHQPISGGQIVVHK